MGTIIKFPAAASARRLGTTVGATSGDRSATIVILPVVRIERQSDDSNGSGPEEGAASGRRRRRRARS